MLPLLVTLQYVTNAKNSVLDRLANEEKGATAVEYGLIVGLIAIVLIGAITALGGNLTARFTEIAGAVA